MNNLLGHRPWFYLPGSHYPFSLHWILPLASFTVHASGTTWCPEILTPGDPSWCQPGPWDQTLHVAPFQSRQTFIAHPGPVFLSSWLLPGGGVSPLQVGYSPASMFQGQDAIFLWEQGKRGSESITLYLLNILLKYVTWKWQKEEKSPLKHLVSCFLRLKRWSHIIRSYKSGW